MKLYDRIIRYGLVVPDSVVKTMGGGEKAHEAIFERIAKATVFVADNAFTHLAALDEKTRDSVVLRDLPSAVPPWPTMLVEWNIPFTSPSFVDWRPWQGWSVERAGWIVDTTRLDPPIAVSSDETGFYFGTGVEAHWMIDASFFVYEPGRVDRHGAPYGPMLSSTTYLDKDGRQIRNGVLAQPYTDAWVGPLGDLIREGDGRVVAPLYRQLWMPTAFAIGLAHCKNVEIIEHPGTFANRQQRRLAERRGEPMPAKFYTLEIAPTLRYVQQNEPSSAHSASHRSMHICRGHFAHYSEDKPLFGKYVGTFWRPAHVRGTEDAGKVFKDYAIKT